MYKPKMKDRNRDRDRDRDRDKDYGFAPVKKKWTGLDAQAIQDISYRDIKLLSRFVSERGKILPRKITGLTQQQQRKITTAVKRARQMGILPYVNYGEGASY